MKLLDFPPSLCENVEVTFHPDTWPEFDKTVDWLIQNGVPLAHGERWSKEGAFLVQMRKGVPYAGGEVVKNSHQQLFGSVSGREASAEYIVYFPQHIR